MTFQLILQAVSIKRTSNWFTGIGQVVEVYDQLTGNAGERTVKDAKIGLTHNFGATGASCVFMYLKGKMTVEEQVIEMLNKNSNSQMYQPWFHSFVYRLLLSKMW